MNASFSNFRQNPVSLNTASSNHREKFTEVNVKVVDKWSRGNSVAIKSQPSLVLQEKTEPKMEPKPKKKNNDRNLQSFNSYLTNEDMVKSVNEYNDTVPDSVEGSYKYDFNIIDVHDMILKKFSHKKQHEILELEEKLKSELQKLKTKQTMVERKASKRIINKINESIHNILSDRDYNIYIQKIKPLLHEYNIIGTLSKIISFATRKNEKNTEDLPEMAETQVKRQELIFDFIEIAKKYIDIDLIREPKEENICPYCSFDLDEIEVDSDEGTIVCPECMVEKVSVVRSRFYADNTRTNNSGNNYEDRANFEKVLMRYQGKQHDKPSDDLYDILEEYFKNNNLPKIDIHKDNKPCYVSSEYIREHIPLNENGEKIGTSRPLMYKALQDTKNSKYYDHINIILSTMWRWKLPDISHLEDQIMDDYDKSQRIYEMLPKDRKSSLNSQFRLYKHLKRLGLDVDSKNFRIPTTHDILEFHENIWSKICQELDWLNN